MLIVQRAEAVIRPIFFSAIESVDYLRSRSFVIQSL
jgi:hypothetical protein